MQRTAIIECDRGVADKEASNDRIVEEMLR